jgi:hypothetical protein
MGRAPDEQFWKQHYVVETDAEEIAGKLGIQSFPSQQRMFPLVSFLAARQDPCILIGPGSGGNSYVFAELAYCMNCHGYNVFIMPRNGGLTVQQLMDRYQDAAGYLSANFGPRLGAFAEGLGGLTTFYVALAGSPLQSLVLQNAPAILDEPEYLTAMVQGPGAARRRKLLAPLLRLVNRALPSLPIPINMYLGWKELIDPASKDVEDRLVRSYLSDPDFDKSYPLSAVVSLISTPAPKPLSELRTPTCLLLARRGFIPDYFRSLFDRFPDITKNLTEVDGGAYWMLSHPKQAARLSCDWFDQTLR